MAACPASVKDINHNRPFHQTQTSALYKDLVAVPYLLISIKVKLDLRHTRLICSHGHLVTKAPRMVPHKCNTRK